MRERERQREEAAEKDRVRACRADLEQSDSDDEALPWARPPYRTSRRALVSALLFCIAECLRPKIRLKHAVCVGVMEGRA